MSRIAFAGNNPCYLEILEYARDEGGVDLVVAFCDREQDPGIGKWLDDAGIESRPLDLLRDPTEAVPVLTRLQPDYLINYNATIIFKPEILEIPEEGCLNMHPGLLPEYAGLHTHQWAIRNGEPEFGSTLHWMEPRVDAGDIVFRETFELSGEETGLSLYLACLEAGGRLVERALDLIAGGEPLPREPQELSVRDLYLHDDALDGTVDWQAGAREILRFFRAGDYGFFESPTYRPQTRYEDQTVMLHEAEPGNPTGARAGTIVSRQNGRIEVACGDGRSIVVGVDGPDTIELREGAVLG